MNIEIRRIHHKDRKSSIGFKDKFLNEYYQRLENESSSAIEACLIFALLWSIGSNIKSHYQRDFEAFLLSRIRELVSLCNYYTKKIEDFACGLMNLAESIKNNRKSLFDFCFNHVKRKWERWDEVSCFIPENPVTDLTSCDLSIKELVFFNKDFLKIESFQNHIQNEATEIYLLPKSHLHYDTITSKKMTYFLNYFLNYGKNVLLASVQQNGKSNLVRDKIWGLLSRPEYSVLQIALTKNMGITQVTKKY